MCPGAKSITRRELTLTSQNTTMTATTSRLSISDEGAHKDAFHRTRHPALPLHAEVPIGPAVVADGLAAAAAVVEERCC
jgi:hypothetical protein